MKSRNLGPWLLAAVVTICCAVLVVTGHSEAVGQGAAIALGVAFVIFMVSML